MQNIRLEKWIEGDDRGEMKMLRPLRDASRALRHRLNDQEGRTLPVQTAALPWRSTGLGQCEILLVTSRDRKRWIIPKGQPMSGKSLAEAAAIEAFEEAGVEGTVNDHPIGSFEHLKAHWLVGPVRYRVIVHELEVERILLEWPEQRERERRWVPASEAANHVQSPQLADVLRDFSRETEPT